MVNVAQLTQAINANLQHMEDHFLIAKKAMGIRPRLDVATLHARETEHAIRQLATLVNEAAAIYGIIMPPDVIKRVNDRQYELLDLANEIAACNAVVDAGNRRISKNVGANASN